MKTSGTGAIPSRRFPYHLRTNSLTISPSSPQNRSYFERSANSFTFPASKVERRTGLRLAFNSCVLRGNIVYSSLVRPSNEEGLWRFALYRSSIRPSSM